MKIILILTLILSLTNCSYTPGTKPPTKPAPILRGSQSKRDALLSYVRNRENDGGERLVLALDQGSEMQITFLYALIDYAPQKFLERYQDKMQDFYDAGFDSIAITANKESGGTSTSTYQIKDFLKKK